MEGVLPERNHAVKFVAVYDDGTDSHAVTAMIAVVNRHSKPTNECPAAAATITDTFSRFPRMA